MHIRWYKLLLIFLAVNLIYACGFFQVAGSDNKPAAAESVTPPPNAAIVPPAAHLLSPQPAATAAPTAKSTEIIAPTKPSKPMIVERFNVANVPGRKGVDGPILALPGQLWTASYLGGLNAWDPQTGQLIKSISSIKAIGYYFTFR